MLEEWNFPENLVSAVRHHHDPARAVPHEALAACVHLGDILAHCLGEAHGFDSFAVRARFEAFDILKIDPVKIDILLLEADSALKGCALLPKRA
jgi:HD-like signal output (HDOD) protein